MGIATNLIDRTNPTIFAAATMQAVWKTIGFVLERDIVACLEAVALERWKYPCDFIPDFALV
jgi:hypothetical protein